MKKAIFLLLVLVMCLGLCACSVGKSSEKVQEDLTSGKWFHDSLSNPSTAHTYAVTTYMFSSGNTFSHYFRNDSINLKYERTGTYIIKEDKIVLCYDDKTSDEYIYYSYRNGQLVLERQYSDGRTTLTYEAY